ncbi:hypothetical protein [Treponema sp. R80B11-R83G3]
MFLPVYSGQKYSYSYEVGTGHYLLFSNDYKNQIYLQGDDARIFRKEIENIDNLPPPQCNDGRITENVIGIYL